MTWPRRGNLFKLGIWVKLRLNYVLDRIIGLCDMVLMDVYGFPGSDVQRVAHRAARYLGDLSWWLRDFPRRSAYKLTGPHWTIVFVGGEVAMRELSHLFFAEGVAEEKLGRIPCWVLRKQTAAWLAEDVDLVICESSGLFPDSPEASIAFAVPSWIHQALDLPESPEALLSGKSMRHVRHNLNRASEVGFSWRFSRSRHDLDQFYHDMYVPYIAGRYGQRALITPYKDQWKRWFVRGGLIVVEKGGAQVAGVLCYRRADTCFAVEAGVLNGDPELRDQGIKVASDWFAVNWACQQGAKVYDMGGTRPWRSDGVFTYKSRWRSKVVRRRRIHGMWTFLAQNLSPLLQDHLNRLGFISEIDGRFYAIVLDDVASSKGDDYIRTELRAVHRQGLSGLAVLSPGRELRTYDGASEPALAA